MEQNGSINYTATRCSKSEEKLTCVGSAAIAAAKHNPLVSFECSTFARWRCVWRCWPVHAMCFHVFSSFLDFSTGAYQCNLIALTGSYWCIWSQMIINLHMQGTYYRMTVTIQQCKIMKNIAKCKRKTKMTKFG